MRVPAIACAVVLFVSGLSRRGAAVEPAPSAFQIRHARVRGERLAYAVHLPPGYRRDRAWPCIVFLNGSGECGTDGEKPTRMGLGPVLLAHPERWPFVVVMPQKPREDEEWEEHEDFVFAALRAVRRTWRIDPDRVALTGVSQGGHGTWMIGARHPDLWSCLVPVCGYGRALTVASRVAKLPVWAFQGLKDDVVDPRETQSIVAELTRWRRLRGSPEPHLTLYPDLGHGCWATAYADSTLPVWILAQRRGRPER
jgi:predicted peptidase